jgi:hypothetical protein
MIRTIMKLLLLFFIFYPQNAFAYIDPGTGGIIIQAIIGALATISIFFSKIKIKIKEFFLKFKKKINNLW